MTARLDAYLTPRSAAAGPTEQVRGGRPLPVLGAMNFGKRTPADESARIIARALERGIRLIDTANVYSDGASETIVGKAVATRRGEVLVATKVGLARRGNAPEGLSKKAVLTACEESLKRLGTDRVDLYYLHAPDHRTPIEETLSAVAELAKAGKIAHLGVSNHASWQLLDISNLCVSMGLEPPRVSQVIYNLLVRQIEVEYLAYARAHPIHTTVYNALAGGLLTGRHQGESAPPKGSRFDNNKMYQRRYWTARFFELVGAYASLAREAGTTPAQLAYAWLAQRPGVDSILLGPASVAQLDEALDALELTLPDDVLARVDEVHRDFAGTDATYAR